MSYCSYTVPTVSLKIYTLAHDDNTVCNKHLYKNQVGNLLLFVKRHFWYRVNSLGVSIYIFDVYLCVNYHFILVDSTYMSNLSPYKNSEQLNMSHFH